MLYCFNKEGKVVPLVRRNDVKAKPLRVLTMAELMAAQRLAELDFRNKLDQQFIAACGVPEEFITQVKVNAIHNKK